MVISIQTLATERLGALPALPVFKLWLRSAWERSRRSPCLAFENDGFAQAIYAVWHNDHMLPAHPQKFRAVPTLYPELGL